ncbi:hypothetical protein [uncultured Desulfobacter sp.]|uniref:hypothetical protein n=1 Tax=uncultured Desulfobacter sp. TaxID=240139 RepID=UPI0029F59C98|nr:hypothetical protein [uncultured Desulfobacter sp.]
MIIRSEKKGNYTILPNEFLLDETISDKARGLLARLLSRPDDWNLNINYLVKTGKAGHAAVRSAIRELEAAGYIQKKVSRHDNGRIIGVEYIIHESPVKSPGDRPAPGQREQSGNETGPQEIQLELFSETSLPAPEPCSQIKEDQSQKTHIQNSGIEDNRMQKTVIKETAPIINTDIKQILRETTTTPEPESEPVICDQAGPLPSSSSNLEILNLVSEKHKSPMVIALVNKAIVDYPEQEVEESIAYAAGNVRGGSMQFRAYLDKALKNKWAAGYLESMQEQSPMDVSWAPTTRGEFTNGFTAGSRRMDANLAACLEFASYGMGKEVTA